MNKKILAVILARGGSKGIPKKNIYMISGHPLISYSIEAAKKSKLIHKIVVSTDDKDIADIANQYGAFTPFIRLIITTIISYPIISKLLLINHLNYLIFFQNTYNRQVFTFINSRWFCKIVPSLYFLLQGFFKWLRLDIGL